MASLKERAEGMLEKLARQRMELTGERDYNKAYLEELRTPEGRDLYAAMGGEPDVPVEKRAVLTTVDAGHQHVLDPDLEPGSAGRTSFESGHDHAYVVGEDGAVEIAAVAAVSGVVGRHAHSVPAGEAAEKRLDEMARAEAARTGDGFHKAYDRVLRTDEGRALYARASR